MAGLKLILRDTNMVLAIFPEQKFMFVLELSYFFNYANFETKVCTQEHIVN